ncbi:3-hydroxyacyl-CoA dehydrogenase family protein [Sphaerimonospora mesophila]|uniref:3-hydroxyacyl-CoA dehydrogenase family protein n=1 Tax=Sphaerimonospora mesophila TaxID=37483 RepID=UPI0006E2A46B
MMRTFDTVGVVGLGTMGAGIAEVFARSGLRVIGVETDENALARGRGHLENSTGRAVARGRMTAEQQREILDRIVFTTSREDLADADLVVEAIPEIMEFKRGLFADLDRICKPSAVLATNTSSLSVTAIAATTSRPGQVIGMHFFNPAPVMRLVEVIETVVTEEGLAAEIAELARRLGKTPVVAGDRAGFVVNRLLLGYLNHACHLLQSGLAGRDDIDTAMKQGVGLPMGPFTLLDLIGLDTSYKVCEVLFGESRDRRHAPAPILRELVTAGLLGRKTGRGFYSYTGEGTAPAPEALSKPAISLVGIVGGGPAAASFVSGLDTAGFKVVIAEAPDLGPVAGADLVIALSDTPVIELAVRLPRPERLVGLHLVGESVAEVVSTVLTSDEAVTAVCDLVTVLGRTPVRCADRAELVVNALLYPYLNDAVRMLECGYASAADIDAAMRLGCGYPAGPFEMLDGIGLEKVRDGLRALYAEYRDPAFAPAPLLDQLVTAGVPSVRSVG